MELDFMFDGSESSDGTTYTEFISRQTPCKILILKLFLVILIAGIIIALIFT